MKKIDAHLHFVDFNQETEGFETLLRVMDECEVEKAVIFGLPVKKKWAYHEPYKPGYYLDGYSMCYYYSLTDEFLADHFLKLAPDDRSRFAPLLCGFDPTDKSSVSYIEYMFDKYDFWKGIGEVLLRHDELSLHTTGELPRINHPSLHGIFEFCIKHELPMLVHHNAQSVGYESRAIYVNELKEVLTRFSDAKIVWAHAGASARTSGEKDYWKILADLLRDYRNLSVDISWKVYQQEILDSENHAKPAYVDLLKEFPDRFMIGSDLTGHFEGHLSHEIGKYEKLVGTLPKEMAEQLFVGNAHKTYFD